MFRQNLFHHVRSKRYEMLVLVVLGHMHISLQSVPTYQMSKVSDPHAVLGLNESKTVGCSPAPSATEAKCSLNLLESTNWNIMPPQKSKGALDSGAVDIKGYQRDHEWRFC